MRRGLKILLGGALGVIALLVLILALLTLFDWNRAKPWINQKVSEATDRHFAINGDLSLSWDRPTTPYLGWRRWIPWPHLRAHDVTLGNPDWASTGPDMARIQQLDFNVNLLPLLRKTISVSSLVLTEPNLNLEQDENGRNNWTFKKKDEGKSAWHMVLQDISITKGTVRLVAQAKKADVTARIDTITDGENTGGIRWKISGKLDRDKVEGSGRAGSLLSLQEHNSDYPVEAELKVGSTEISAKGTLNDPVHLSALDVNLKILGASMSQLFPLTGIVLPATPKFSTEGRVVGKIGLGSTRLRYEKFTGKAGNSDIAGTLEYIQQKPRPLLRGEITSSYLNFKDLGALVGADSPEAQKKRGAESKQPPDKVLPVQNFKTERWSKIDAQVQFSGAKIVRTENLPIDNLFTKVSLNNGVLSLAPLNFGIAGGKLSSEVKIDGHADPAKAFMKIAARGIKLRNLFPSVESMQASLGEIGGNAELTAAGNSIAALLGSSNGEIKALITEGSISKFILEAIGLNVGSAIVAKVFGDHEVKLNCMASDFKVTDGLVDTRMFVLDTEDATIFMNGSVNLATEKLNLAINPQSKGVRLISFRAPFYVQGTFKKPDISVDKGVVAMKAGAATVLGTAAAPLAALLALVNPGPAEDSPCGQLLAQAQKKPEAPPPGKTASGKTATEK
nr:AsmA family protein [Noviherbaspirillum massiliense]